MKANKLIQLLENYRFIYRFEDQTQKNPQIILRIPDDGYEPSHSDIPFDRVRATAYATYDQMGKLLGKPHDIDFSLELAIWYAEVGHTESQKNIVMIRGKMDSKGKITWRFSSFNNYWAEVVANYIEQKIERPSHLGISITTKPKVDIE